jgi:protein TonB
MLEQTSVLDEPDQLERKGQFGANFFGSFGLHLVILGALGFSIWLHIHLHGSNWGAGNMNSAIQASLVSSAPSVPLPSDLPPTKNVLATETPSAAPAIPEKKAEPAPDLKAVPIATKQQDKPKPEPPKPQPQQEQKHPQQPPDQHRANFGEQQAANLPRSMANSPNTSNSPVTVAGGDFASRFGYYVNGITRRVSENWYKQEVDPATPEGAQTVVIFSIARDGTPSGFRIGRSSGSPSLDTSAIRAAQRVDSFGPLPSSYNGSNVEVAYTFTYEQSGH